MHKLLNWRFCPTRRLSRLYIYIWTPLVTRYRAQRIPFCSSIEYTMRAGPRSTTGTGLRVAVAVLCCKGPFWPEGGEGRRYTGWSTERRGVVLTHYRGNGNEIDSHQKWALPFCCPPIMFPPRPLPHLISSLPVGHLPLPPTHQS